MQNPECFACSRHVEGQTSDHKVPQKQREILTILEAKASSCPGYNRSTICMHYCTILYTPVKIISADATSST